MILGVHPEDRDRRYVVFCADALGELKRGERLEQRKEWSAEESGLLTGDDSHGPWIGEDRGCCQRNRRRTAPLLLRLEQLDESIALPALP